MPRRSVIRRKQQIGQGFATLVRSLPRILRSFGPRLSALTRGVRGGSRGLIRSAPKTARRFGKKARKLATKKNLKRVGKAAAIAAGTGAVTGAAKHGVRRLLGE